MIHFDTIDMDYIQSVWAKSAAPVSIYDAPVAERTYDEGVADADAYCQYLMETDPEFASAVLSNEQARAELRAL